MTQKWIDEQDEYSVGDSAFLISFVKPRHYKFWNGPVRRGWWTKKEAQAVADQLNKEILT